jgi:5,10-methylene-tetrahydrofolate dehydrogenase/methenyl tetrahydrofolate cyclohydrolase
VGDHDLNAWSEARFPLVNSSIRQFVNIIAPMDLQLRDKVAIVTGSSRGIGLSTVKALAAEGCRVTLCGRTETTL